MRIIETIYLYLLIAAAIATVFLLFFGDAFDIEFGEGQLINPIIIVSFLAIFSGLALVLEKENFFDWGSLVIGIVSAVIAGGIVLIINMFVYKPLRKAERNISRTLEDTIGLEGELIVPIPKDGLGEVLLKTQLEIFSYPVKDVNNEEIQEGEKVKVLSVDAEEGILTVEKVKVLSVDVDAEESIVTVEKT